ncbi:hypothetical protein C7443_105175 [Plasticicumulans acidivorans]|uniref:Uncharacterized protein n=1 Tax=Plasticicumulans acidivorans TaxID=886464 RepID=A0A317MUW5_9GAMM|nr:hypothetical protein C7443_105175 [Plasticicumulans acidivorans]
MSTPAGLAKPRTNATTNALSSRTGTLCRLNIIQAHNHSYLFNFQQVRNLVHHAPVFRGIDNKCTMIHPTQPKTTHARFMGCQATCRALHKSHFDLLICGHGLPQNIFNFLAALGCNVIRRGHSFEAINCGAYHINRITRTYTFREHILNANDLKHRAHSTTGDNSRTFRCWLHKHICSTMLAFQRVLKSATCKCDGAHILTRFLHRLLYRHRDFTGLPIAKTNAPLSVPHHSQCSEAKLAAAFHNFSDTIYSNELFMQTIGALRTFNIRSHYSTFRTASRSHAPHRQAPAHVRGT